MRVLQIATAVAMVLAGCTAPPEDPAAPAEAGTVSVTGAASTQVLVSDGSMTFEARVIDVAASWGTDLYEPTMEVSDSGVIYVTGHTVLVDTTGAPVFVSRDDGATWSQLPFWDTMTMPATVPGATPPPSDEIFLVAGDDGRLWGVDITLAAFPVNGWCDDGARHCYHNPDAYDEAAAATQRVETASSPGSHCSLTNTNDRPWAAYANGTLLMTNHPQLSGPVQVGIMDVPAGLVGGPGLGMAEPLHAEWNLCASDARGTVPGIPAIRDDHSFVVPQVQGDQFVVVRGQGNVHDVEQVTVFSNTNVDAAGAATGNWGHAVFDRQGTVFLGVRNNTADGGDIRGRLHLAVSTDAGRSFDELTLELDSPSSSLYLDGNMAGPGALLTWAQHGLGGGTDWYAAHLTLGADGAPVVSQATRVIEDGPVPSADVQGAAAGPDGRAYLVTSDAYYAVGDPLGSITPLKVWVQTSGPTLPVSA